MTWEVPKYSRNTIDQAGVILKDNVGAESQRDLALEVLDNWRAIHSYPMHVFKIRLKDKSKKIDQNSLTAQRLKRVPAILYKLRRKYNGKPPSMKLSQMQDIGGCRAVLSNVVLAKKLYNEYYLKGDLKHKKVGVKDYISKPKKDGYRSIHVIYKFNSDKGKRIYNGLLIEIQIRSKIQHQWATAVELVDFFTRQAIKSNAGQQEWMDFFKLVSSAFAQIECCPCVPDTPSDEKELYLQIKEMEKKLNVINRMDFWTKGFQTFDNTVHKQKYQYFMLTINFIAKSVTVSAFPKSLEKKAILEYADAEKRYKGKKEYDVVLVGADTKHELEKAYPNYFADCKEFVTLLKKIINKYE
jgi:ppGpp synthetase/RelA/SpoT-type nucleotidyltranferase